jgi:hypothetical protein
MAFDVQKTNIEITATDKTAAAFNSVKSSIGNLTSQFGALTGLLGAGAFIAFTKRIIDQADAMNDLSKRTGIAVEQIGAWKLATEQSGTSIGALTQALGKGAKYLVEHGDNLKKIGINAKTSEELILQLSGIISKMPSDDPRRTALAMEVLGKSAGELIPLLSEGEQELGKMLARGRELNPVTEEMAKNADKFNDSLAEMKLISNGLFVNLVGNILPSFNTYLLQLKAVVDEGDWLDKLLFFTVGYVPGKISDKTESPQVQIQKYTQHIKDLKAELKKTGGTDIFGMQKDGGIFGSKDSIEKQIAAAEAGLAAQKLRLPAFAPKHSSNPSSYDATLSEDTLNAFLKPASANSAKKLANDMKDQLAAAQKVVDEKIERDKKFFYAELEEEEYFKKEQLKNIAEIEKEKQETQKKWFDLEEKNILEAQKLREDALEKLAQQEQEIARDINKSLTDALLRGFESGKGFAKNFRDTLVNMFKTLVLQPAISFLIDSSGITKLLGGLGAAFSGSASAATGASGGGSILSSLSGIGNLFSQGNSAIVSSIESLGTFLSTGTGGLGDMIGGALGQYSGQIANVLPFAGAAFSLLTGDVKGALGSALGAALTFTPLGPVGGIIGSVLGSALGGVFGKKKPRAKIISSTAQSYYENGEIVSNNNAPYASGKRFVELGAQTQLNGLNEAFSKTLGALLSGYGLDDKISTYSFVGQRKKTARGIFSASVNGQSAYSYDVGGNGDAQSAFSAMMEAVLGAGVSQSILKSALPEGIKKFFESLTKKEDVNDAVNTLLGLKSGLLDLPAVFDAIRNAIDTTSYTTSIADLKSRFAAIGTYTSLFYTQQEQFDTFTKQINTQFGALGAVVPKTRDEFRALVDGIKVTDESSSNLFHGLVALAPAMDAFYKQIEQINGAVSRDSFTSRLDADRYAGVSANYGSTFASDYTSNLNAGRIIVGANGVATTESGNTNLLAEVKMLRTAVEAVAVSTSKTVSELKKYYATALPVTVVN